jgi:hypothetical protein
VFGYPLMEKKARLGLICALKFPTMETHRMARYEAPSPAKKVGRKWGRVGREAVVDLPCRAKIFWPLSLAMNSFPLGFCTTLETLVL